jgi:hypothetical protein
MIKNKITEKETVKFIRKRYAEMKKYEKEVVLPNLKRQADLWNAKPWYERLPIIGNLLYKLKMSRFIVSRGTHAASGNKITWKETFPVSKRK